MDRRERSASADTALLAAVQGALSSVWTSIPCVVASDLVPGKRTITCQPVIQSRVLRKDGTFTWVQLPVLLDVLVHFPEGGGVTMTFPVKAGDECLVVLAARCLDDWWEKGGIQQQPDLRMHDLSDGIAFVGISSVPRVIADISTSRAQFRSNDGQAFVEIDPSSHLIRAKTSGNLEAEVAADMKATVGGNITAAATGNVSVTAAGTMDLKATGALTLTSSTLISLASPAVNLTALPGSVTSMSGGTFNVSNTTWNYSNNAIAYAGGTFTYNGKNMTNTHFHVNSGGTGNGGAVG